MAMPDVNSLLTLALAGMAFVIGAGLLGIGGLLVVVFLLLVASILRGSLAARRLVAKTLRDPRFQPTDEVFLDHRSGRVMRVYADPRTGERRYVPE
jgi:hypothetical protein